MVHAAAQSLRLSWRILISGLEGLMRRVGTIKPSQLMCFDEEVGIVGLNFRKEGRNEPLRVRIKPSIAIDRDESEGVEEFLYLGFVQSAQRYWRVNWQCIWQKMLYDQLMYCHLFFPKPMIIGRTLKRSGQCFVRNLWITELLLCYNKKKTWNLVMQMSQYVIVYYPDLKTSGCCLS